MSAKATRLVGGKIVREGNDLVDAEVLIVGDRIVQVGQTDAAASADVIDLEGRLVVPGFVDAHSHLDGAVFREEAQLSQLRQGVTSVLVGQDGVSYAPGNGQYGSEYFAAINGEHPTYSGGGVADLLATYDGTTPLNVGYFIPAGTVQFEVMGSSSREPSAAEIDRMLHLVRLGMTDGALGLSTGLDYTPGIFASTALLSRLVGEIAPFGGVYVTHMRGGYESNSAFGVDEAAEIVRPSGARLHVSHMHADADDVIGLFDALRTNGIDGTYDAYPYGRGSTILSMLLLPPELLEMAPTETVAALGDPAVRERLIAEWIPRVAQYPSLGEAWPTMITIAHVPAAEFAWAPGLTLAAVAERLGTDPAGAAFDLLAAGGLNVGVVMATRRERPAGELGRIMGYSAHLGGSDGIHQGAHPHPRGYGCFATYLETFREQLGVYTWESAIEHLSTRTVGRFGLGERGAIAPGAVADLAIVDPEGVRSRATYAEPKALADGIDDVFVAGERVLAGGQLTGATPGRGLRLDRGIR